ncbi:ABC transporter substrate-binding protein [Humibacter ginsenosidimutans]|uniref:ABC transporter substrate-binding protein n=1 Tax=Humibacter ginsenosidimutans TaxID=2599293 RepID=A0A5B8M6J7_9MICO|nr:ABC transporter substrate-binding protein [Humibacter ginsenosidimutans]QDZ16197.1 ABC transporter substrate-binding protein [Humibacter ginsenosidimutans]
MSKNITRTLRRSGPFMKAAVVATAIATVAVLSGCSSGSGGSTSTSSASGNATKGSITWWASPITTSGADPRTVLISAFEKAYPNIHVKLISAPNDTDTNRATLTTQISGGGGPDVYMGDVIWPAQFGAHQLAEPLSKYLPKSYWDSFASGLVAGATYNGQVYGAPFFEDQGFLYYRKDILKADGLKVPTTWEELVSDSKIAQSKGQVKYGYVFQGANYEGATCNFMEFLADAGGKVLNSKADASALNSSAATKALTFEQSLVTSGVSPQATSTFQETQSMNAFSAGDSLFLRNWDYAYSTSQASGSAVIGKVGVAPMPTFQGESAPGYSNIGGWNLYVNPHSKNVAADLTFIKWMTGKDAQTTLATKFSEIPTNAAVRSSSEVKNANPVLAIVSQTKLIARPSQTPNYPEVSQAIYSNVNGVLAGSLTPQAAIQKANSQINTAVKNGGL